MYLGHFYDKINVKLKYIRKNENRDILEGGMD